MLGGTVEASDDSQLADVVDLKQYHLIEIWKICVKMKIRDPKVIKVAPEEFADTSISECEVGNDLQKLLENISFADMTISCADKQFKVNKCILAARSPVFMSMFRSNEKQALNCNAVTIKDTDSGPFELFIKYLYTGVITIPNIDFLEAVLNLAEKYQVE